MSPTRLPFSHAAYNPFGGNVQPLAPRRGGERFAQIACRAVGLIRLRLPLPEASSAACFCSQLGFAKALMASVQSMSGSSVSGQTHTPLPIRLRKTRFQTQLRSMRRAGHFHPTGGCATVPASWAVQRWAFRCASHCPKPFRSSTAFSAPAVTSISWQSGAHLRRTATTKTASRHPCRAAR